MSGFPGKAYDKCWDCKKIKKYIDNARKIYNNQNLSDEFILSWVMKESSWVTTASAYGWSKGKSSATGLTMITRSTWNLPGVQSNIPTGLSKSWEQITTDPTTSIAAGVYVLDKHRGRTIDQKLADYKGKGGAAYVQKIRKGEKILQKLLKGQSIDKLSPTKCEKLLKILDRALR